MKNTSIYWHGGNVVKNSKRNCLLKVLIAPITMSKW